MNLFDKKGECKYCGKETRAKATSLCNACFRLDVAIKNNPEAAKKIIQDHEDRRQALGPRRVASPE